MLFIRFMDYKDRIIKGEEIVFIMVCCFVFVCWCFFCFCFGYGMDEVMMWFSMHEKYEKSENRFKKMTVLRYMDDRRKFRSQTSDNMERWKAEQGRGIEKRKIRRKKIRRERVRRQKIQMREKVGKSRNTVFFQWFGAPEGRKVGSLKRRAEPAGQMRDEKLHAVVARSTFPSQNVQNTSVSDDFWKLRCRKSARRCGAKHTWKSKC